MICRVFPEWSRMAGTIAVDRDKDREPVGRGTCRDRDMDRDRELVARVTSRLLGALGKEEGGQALPRELLVGLHCVLGNSLLTAGI